jgi:AraC-like DNA-binding protein
MDQDLSLDLLADEVQLSKFHSHQLFRRVTGEAPKSYVDRLRLERAALQLRIRRASVLEIALEMRLRESRDAQPGISRPIRHVAARLSTAVFSPRKRQTKRANPSRDERGTIR